MALTYQLYGLYVELVRQIAQGEADDPQQLCATLIAAVAREFPDRPWAELGQP